MRGAIAAVAGVALVAVGVVLSVWPPPPKRVQWVEGSVLRQDDDVRKQRPIAGAEILAGWPSTGRVVSDAAGSFRLRLEPAVNSGDSLTVTVRHADYQAVEITAPANGDLLIARMEPLRPEADAQTTHADVPVSDVRVRYTVKGTHTVNVGSLVRTFEGVNTGNVPCAGPGPCSPDGKWQAAWASTLLDAGAGNEFRDIRVSCIAGPCGFARIEQHGAGNGRQRVEVRVLNWSDTTMFLVEAEVIQTKISDMVLLSYPAIFGRAMNFSVPAAAQGLTIQAELGGTAVVFPLGPKLQLSWAQCTSAIEPDHTRLFRCELKSGYRFQ